MSTPEQISENTTIIVETNVPEITHSNCVRSFSGILQYLKDVCNKSMSVVLTGEFWLLFILISILAIMLIVIFNIFGYMGIAIVFGIFLCTICMILCGQYFQRSNTEETLRRHLGDT